MSAPKNELLRKTLEARRAQDTSIQSSPKPAPLTTLPPRPAAPPSARPQQLHTPAASPDAFDEFDLPDDLMTPESPIQKRRPRSNDGVVPRGKTNQELSAEVLKLREDLITEKLRCELTKDNQNEAHAKWLEAKEEVERLSRLDLEMREVEAENWQLKDLLETHQENMDSIDDMYEKIDMLQSERDAVEERSALLQADLDDLKKATAAELANMEDAFKEAVDLVHSHESEKADLLKKNSDLNSENERLKKEFDSLKMRMAAIEMKHVDGSSNYPPHVMVDASLDEHRPATSYDDSDYYSQPATPRADVEHDAQSLRSVTSDRSRQFIELTRERTRSARRLSKRMSDASLRAASVFSAFQAPEVPQIPEELAEVTPRTVDERFRERRYHQSNAEQVAAMSVTSMRRPATVAPVQTHQPSGLRSAYRPDQVQGSSTSRPLSSHTLSPSQTSRTAAREGSAVESVPVPPPRMSSRQAHTYSESRLRPRTSDATFESNTICGTLVGSEGQTQEQVLTAWNSASPRTCAESSLTSSPRVDVVDKERWWKDTERVRPLLRTRATTRTLRADSSLDDDDSGSETFGNRAGGVRTSPTTPVGARPAEKDFLFNPRENEEDFMRKTIAKLRGSMRRRQNEPL